MKAFFRNKFTILSIILLLLITFGLLTITFHFECPLYTHFDVKCPFCGARKMVMALLHLNFTEAFNANQLLFILLPIVFILIFIKYILNKNIKIHKSLYILLMLITVIFTVLRNII